MVSEGQPRDGWRAFLGEVGIIVLGVLVALAIGVIADAIRWRLRAAELRQAIYSEVAVNAGVHDERTLVQPCLERRIAQIDELLREARVSGTIPAIGEIGRPPIRPISTDVWELASGSEALLYFDSGELKLLSMHNSTMLENRAQVLQEQESWSTLRALEGAGGPISDSLASELTLVLGRLRFQNYLNGLEAEQGVTTARRMGHSPNYYNIVDREERRRETVIELARERSVCKPLQVGGKAVA